MKILPLLLLAPCAVTAGAQVAHFPFDIKGGQIYETVSNNRFGINGQFKPENLASPSGNALRFDGYSTCVDASLNNILPDARQMTVSLLCALECYPIVEIDKNTTEKVALADCLDTDKKSGFAFRIGFDGRYSFTTYAGGWELNLEATEPLPLYTWCNLVAVIDADAGTARLLLNGKEVASGRCTGPVSVSGNKLRFSRSLNDRNMGPFRLTSFCGALDDLAIYDRAMSQNEIEALTPSDIDAAEAMAIPASRFADDLLRPRFHGMPAAGWTNECHGMAYRDGRYHLFFQKNANGPYMARLHWGHISSANLYDWREEKIAIIPGAPYDIKGCWSGCVFTDPELTGNLPGAIYTAVDYAKATMAMATPEDASLIKWNKKEGNPIINGRPGGLSDDFRDPYFFRNGTDAYLIVGSSQNGTGTTTLHKYNNGRWSEAGRFFTGNNATQCGTFWEMPNVTPMADGRWLFTATPLNTSTGVHTLYWTGTINADGTFTPDTASATPRGVELTSRDGYGMLSPTILQKDGRTIALGIVPDKLPGEENYRLGWAHCYSLPREWSLDAGGALVQKPLPEMAGMHTDAKFEKNDFELSGSMDLGDVTGRSVELLGTFKVGTTPVGFTIFRGAEGQGTITYNPATGELIADFSGLERIHNDDGSYNGIYRASLPEFLRAGSELKLNVFVDHSIVDIFVNDRWATSIRVFPTATDADGVQVIAPSGPAKVKSLSAWVLDPKADSSVATLTQTDAPGTAYTPAGLPASPDYRGILLRHGTKTLNK